MLTVKNKRKEFFFHIEISDNQLWAVGMVVVQWGLIEQLITIITHALVGDDTAKRDGFNKTWAHAKRIAMMEELASAKLREPFLSQFQSFVAEIKNIQDIRDKIVHGSWGHEGDDAKKNPPDPNNPQASSVGHFGPPHAPFKWRASFGELQKVVKRIDALHKSITQWIIANRRPREDGHEGFLFGDSIKAMFKT
jgi:hypothetical protein